MQPESAARSAAATVAPALLLRIAAEGADLLPALEHLAPEIWVLELLVLLEPAAVWLRHGALEDVERLELRLPGLHGGFDGRDHRLRQVAEALPRGGEVLGLGERLCGL